jgi:hypothetical protein
VALSWDTDESLLPHGAAHRSGDQRRPQLAGSALPPGGALIAGWDDLGMGFGAGEDQQDAVLTVEPVPMSTGSMPLNGMVLWLRAGDGSTQPGQWNDISGAGHNASQAPMANAPVYSATGGPNGVPTFTFDGTQAFAIPSALFSGVHHWTFFVVQDVLVNTARQDPVSIGAGPTGSTGVDVALTGALRNVVLNNVQNESYGQQTAVGSWEAWAVWDDGAAQHVDVNGVSQGVVGTGSANLFTSPTQIGSGSNPQWSLHGNLAEVIAYDRTLSAEEIQVVEGYLRKRTGIW